MLIEMALVDSKGQVEIFKCDSQKIFLKCSVEELLSRLEALDSTKEWKSCELEGPNYIKLYYVFEKTINNQELYEKLAEISHEINNPLAIVLSSLKVMRKIMSKDEIDKDFLIENIDDIEGSIERVKNFLIQQRAAVKDGSREYLEFRVSELMDSLKSHFFLLFSEMNVDFHIQADSNVLRSSVSVVGTTLSQCLFNLVNNAYYELKKQESKKITITLDEREGTLYISIIDNGRGIPKDQQEKIFEMNYTTKGNEGSGLGLYLVRKYLELNNGLIGLDKNYSEGAKFDIELPMLNKRNRPTVLFVDDEVSVLEFFKDLSDVNFDVLVASNANTALTIVKGGQVDLIVSDLRMPKLTGLDFLKMARGIYHDIPFIMFSGFVSDKVKSQVMKAGQSYVIHKPGFDELYKLIDKVLEES